MMNRDSGDKVNSNTKGFRKSIKCLFPVCKNNHSLLYGLPNAPQNPVAPLKLSIFIRKLQWTETIEIHYKSSLKLEHSTLVEFWGF